jgi:hypothetical protein
MFSECKHITKKLHIDPEFPKDKLMNIMKPYLHLYYTWIHATNGTYKQCNAEYELKRKLRLFINFNPRFGRKYCSVKRIMFNRKKIEYYFNDEHMNFYKEYDQSILINKPVLSRVRRAYVYEDDDELEGENIVYSGRSPSFFYNQYEQDVVQDDQNEQDVVQDDQQDTSSYETPVLEDEDDDDVPDLIYNFDTSFTANNDVYMEDDEDEDEEENDDGSIS